MYVLSLVLLIEFVTFGVIPKQLWSIVYGGPVFEQFFGTALFHIFWGGNIGLRLEKGTIEVTNFASSSVVALHSMLESANTQISSQISSTVLLFARFLMSSELRHRTPNTLWTEIIEIPRQKGFLSADFL